MYRGSSLNALTQSSTVAYVLSSSTAVESLDIRAVTTPALARSLFNSSSSAWLARIPDWLDMVYMYDVVVCRYLGGGQTVPFELPW